MEVNSLLLPRRSPSLRRLGRRVRIPQRPSRGVIPRVVTRTTPRAPCILQRPATRRRRRRVPTCTPLRVLPRERKLVRRPRRPRSLLSRSRTRRIRSTRRYRRRLPRKRKALRRAAPRRRRNRIRRTRSIPRNPIRPRRRRRSRSSCPIRRSTLRLIRWLAIRPEHRLPRLLIGKRATALRPRHRRREHQPQPGTHQTQSSQHPHQPHTPIRRHPAQPR